MLLVPPRLWVASTAMTRPAPLLVVALLVAVLAALAAAADAPSASHSAVKNSKNSMHKSASRSSSDKDETKGAGKSSSSSSSSTASGSKSTSSSSSKGAAGGGGGVGVNDSSNQNFTLDALPKTWQAGQKGTNQCNQWGKGSQDSLCQNAFINSLDDFCLWAPPEVGPIGETERIEVAWCMKPG